VSTRHAETERTYDLPDQAAALPDLATTTDGAVVSMSEPRLDELEATYVDTDDLRLLRSRITLRRRTGGADAGWHLKLPPEADTRQEVHWPLGEGTDVPEEVAWTVTAASAGAPLRPVVRLATSRRRSLLIGSEGQTLAELCDDRVSATRLDPAGSVTEWREVEVELVDGTAHTLDAVQAALMSAGAVLAPTPSKLARALDAHPALQQTVDPALPDRSSTAGDVLVAYLATHLERLRRADVELRVDPDGEGVHDLRVQSRRLRTALAVFRPLVDEATARHLERELKLLGRVLSQARDRQVAAQLLAERLGDDERAGEIGALYERQLAVDEHLVTAGMRAALGSRQYTDLLRGLEAVSEEQLLSPLAHEPARTVLSDSLRSALRRVEDHAKAARRAGGSQRIEALHDLRKSAKRLRYACEVVEPVSGKPAARMVRRSKQLQEVLGLHLDRVALMDQLEPLARLQGATAADGFSLGRLYERLSRQSEQAGGEYLRAVRRVSNGKATRWLR
jgi:CHAD domain-containing protein